MRDAEPSREKMLDQLQADVNAWPRRVREAGVTIKGGAAYVPVARNVTILRTPDDPEATLAAMIAPWEARDDDDESGSDGWFRVVAQAGKELTWEYLMADESKPYAPLFPEQIKQRVRIALDRHESTRQFEEHQAGAAADEAERRQRIDLIRAEMRKGTRKRVFFDLDRPH